MKTAVPAQLLFSQCIAHSWPRRTGVRFALYLALCILDWIGPPFGSLACVVPLLIIYYKNRIAHRNFLKNLGGMWILILFPLALALPALKPEIVLEGLYRSLCVFVLFWSTYWFSTRTSMEETRTLSLGLFSFFGPRTARILGTTLAMTLAFIPWIYGESNKTREALLLRQPKASRIRQLFFLGTPLILRLFGKVRQTADAMELRDALEPESPEQAQSSRAII